MEKYFSKKFFLARFMPLKILDEFNSKYDWIINYEQY